MNVGVPTYFTQQFTSNLQMLLQQRGSRLRMAVMTGSHTGEKAVAVDQIGPVEAKLVTGRFQPLTPDDSPTDRRWVVPGDFDYNELIDTFDKLRMIIDPTSAIVQNGVYAIGRAMDREIVRAILGVAQTGKTGTTATPLPASQIVPVNTGGTNTGLNKDKLVEARKRLMAAEVDVDNDQLWVAITAAQHADLLKETQVVNTDYVSRPVLTDGRITQYLGFNFVHYEGSPLVATQTRGIPVWAKSGVHLGIWKDIWSNVDQRKDLSGLPWQVYVSSTFGATRLEEKKVVQINCYEA